MAEGLARNYFRGRFNIFSAGVDAQGLNQTAVSVMNEIGIDISSNKSQNIDEFKDFDLDLVVTVCDNARESCPIFPGDVKVIHQSFDDPPALAEKAVSKEEAFNCYRTVRDEIKFFIELKLENLL